MYSLVCVCSVHMYVYYTFLMAESFTYKELSYLTISSIQNEAKNVLKSQQKRLLRSPDRGDQSPLTSLHAFKYRKKKS